MKQGCVTLVFDDGYQHILDTVIPELDSKGLPGVFAVPVDASAVEKSEGVPVADFVTWQRRLKQTRHELAAHGVSHRALANLSKQELQRELFTPAKYGLTSLVYPGGSYSDEVKQYAAKWYRCARTTRFGIESLPPRNLYELTTVNYTRDNFNVLKANIRAWLAAMTGKWLIETFHLVGDFDAQHIHSVPLRELKAHLNFLQNRGIKVATFHEVVRNYHN